MKRIGLGLVALSLVIAAAGCTSGDDDGPSSSQAETLIEALTRAVRWENARRKDGEIEELDPAAKTVQLDSSGTLGLKAGAAAIMALDIDNPTDDPVVATLMQFEGAEGHSEIPAGGARDGGAGGGGDAGSASDGTGKLHVDNPCNVEADICEHLCAKRYTTKLKFAVKLASGAVSRQGSITVTLDCTKKGDPDLCDGEPGGSGKDAGSPDEPERDAGTGNPKPGMDGGAMSGRDGATGNDASSMPLDGGPRPEQPPQIGPISPESTTAGTAVALTINGTGFLPGAKAFVDGSEVATTVSNETLVMADVPASRTGYAGSLVVYVENVPGYASTRSNVLYLTVTPAAGAPTVYDYSPDNGVAGDKVLIIASNLANQTLTITDAKGTTLTPGTLGTISWPTAGLVDTVEITLPDEIATGPITVANALGSYKGKIFSVGLNLTRAEGTVLTSSTQYNTSNWSTASGGDNSLATSFFTAHGDCATLTTCTTKPFYEITFASPQTVARIAMRGNREYASGYDFIRGTFEVRSASGAVMWSGDYDLPAPDRDLDITLPDPVYGTTVRFTSLADESDEPGFSELEVFGP